MRRAWIIAMLIALLPLHGWAGAILAVRMASPAAPLEAAAVEMPCHAAAADSTIADAATDADDPGHDCAICHLCHAWAAVLNGDIVSPRSAGPDAAPLAHPRDTGRLMAAGLERPPRA